MRDRPINATAWVSGAVLGSPQSLGGLELAAPPKRFWVVAGVTWGLEQRSTSSRAAQQPLEVGYFLVSRHLGHSCTLPCGTFCQLLPLPWPHRELSGLRSIEPLSPQKQKRIEHRSSAAALEPLPTGFSILYFFTNCVGMELGQACLQANNHYTHQMPCWPTAGLPLPERWSTPQAGDPGGACRHPVPGHVHSEPGGRSSGDALFGGAPPPALLLSCTRPAWRDLDMVGTFSARGQACSGTVRYSLVQEVQGTVRTLGREAQLSRTLICRRLPAGAGGGQAAQGACQDGGHALRHDHRGH